MEELSEEQIEEFREAFSLFDPENQGFIYTKELGTVLRSLGIHASDDEKKEFIKKFDTNGEGKLYFWQFLEIIVCKITETKPEEEIKEAFRLFDTEKMRKISLDNFKEILRTYSNNIDEEERKDICDFLKPCCEEDSDCFDYDKAVQNLTDIIKSHINN